jgi:hypothetical protein
VVKPNRKTRASTLSKIQQKWISPPKDKLWAKIPVDVLDEERWHGLSITELRVMDALICQHFRYRQKDNGDLQVSYGGFLRAGASHGKYVAEAIKRLLAKGMIESKQGIPANPYMWRPNMYGITMYLENGGYIESANRNFVFVPVDVMEARPGAAYQSTPGASSTAY